jgi:hypothetical protein
MNPASPITVPKNTMGRPPLPHMGVIRSNPTATNARPKDAVVLTPNLVASRPATGAATEASVMGGQERPGRAQAVPQHLLELER